VTTYLPRSAWTRHVPAGLTPLNRDEVEGVALHWPGTDEPIGPAPRASIARRLEGYRRGHVRDRGWNDIAYQVAVDQAGRVWDLRGIRHRSAANGDTGPNRRWGAVLVLVGPGEALTDECKQALRDWYRDQWLARYPRATRVVEHRDVRPDATECPGPAVRAFIDSGAITKPARPDAAPVTPAPTLEDDMFIAHTAGPDKTQYLVIGIAKIALPNRRVADELRLKGIRDVGDMTGETLSVFATVDASSVAELVEVVPGRVATLAGR
jgi:hypothetical protein